MEPHSSDVCSLCKSQHSRMSNVQTWQNSQATLYIQTLGIALDSLICRPCRDDVRRVLADPSHVPRWSKRKERSKRCIKSCLEVSFVSSNLANTEKMNQIIKQVDFEIEGDDIPIPTPLCKHHYYTIYNLIQPQQTNCPTCGVNLKQSHTLRSFYLFRCSPTTHSLVGRYQTKYLGPHHHRDTNGSINRGSLAALEKVMLGNRHVEAGRQKHYASCNHYRFWMESR